MERIAKVARQTNETKIELQLNIDGRGIYKIATGIPFMDHMLNLFAKHGFFDLEIKAQGDIEVDDHHTVEDLGLCLGQAFLESSGDKKGIVRYGFFVLPMDECLAEVAVDFSGRPFFKWNVVWQQEKVKNFDLSLIEEFWRAFAVKAQVNLHINLRTGKDGHHIAEAIFKTAARAFDRALTLDSRSTDVPSTKGTLSK